MAVVSMMRFSGDPDELTKAFDEMGPVTEQLAAKHGGLANIVARDADGLLVINVWETEEGRHAMAQEPQILEGLRASGLPQPDFTGYEILALRVSDRLAAHATSSW